MTTKRASRDSKRTHPAPYPPGTDDLLAELAAAMLLPVQPGEVTAAALAAETGVGNDAALAELRRREKRGELERVRRRGPRNVPTQAWRRATKA